MVICRSWNSPTCIQSHILRCSDTLHSAVHTISYTGNSSIPVWNTQDRPNICIRHTCSMCQSSKPNSTEIQLGAQYALESMNHCATLHTTTDIRIYICEIDSSEANMVAIICRKVAFSPLDYIIFGTLCIF